MTAAQYIMLAAAVLSGLAWRWNATSAALAFSYFATQAWWLVAGRTLGSDDLFMIDVFTIALIYAKAISRCAEQDFGSGWHQLRCFLRAPTMCDRIILALYPLGIWTAYIANVSDFSRWWLLYLWSMIQFMIAGSEALFEWRSAKAPFDEPDIPSSGFMFAVARAGRWST